VLYHIVAAQVDGASHDSGMLEIGQLSARLAYAMMCFTLTWGVLTSMGWVNRFTGRQALRSGHMILATLTLAFAGVHIVAFTLLEIQPFTLEQVAIPFNTGSKLRHSMGILSFEVMLGAAIVVGLRRWMTYYRWMWLHRLAYPAFVLGVGHALLGAMANGTLASLWLFGITLLIPAFTVTFLRFMPAKALATAGLIEDGP
jgi:sulfoxide reductase heme-binding subunit YedZ